MTLRRLAIFNAILGIAFAFAAVAATVTGASFWGWATFILLAVLAASIASAAAGKGRP